MTRALLRGALLLVVWTPIARAERLPLRGYTAEDGLPHDRVECIHQDASGFLWFCTPGGLALFDGYSFSTFGTEHGLPDRNVAALQETGPGEYWVATAGGLCRFDAAASRCTVHALPDAATPYTHALLREPDGRLWAAGGGVLAVSPGSGADAAFRSVPLPRRLSIRRIARGSDGTLWLGTTSGLWRRRPDGDVAHVPVSRAPDAGIAMVDADRHGLVWVGTSAGLFVLHPGPEATAGRTLARCPDVLAELPAGANCERLAAALPRAITRAIVHGSDGLTRVGTQNSGLVTLGPGEPVRHTVDHGLANDAIRSLLEDRDGNLWIGTEARGAQKVVRSGFVSYGRADGFVNGRIVSIFEDAQRDLHVVNAASTLFRLEGRRFADVRPRVPGSFTGGLGFGGRVALFDRDGRFWTGGTGGLRRFPAVPTLADLARAAPRQMDAGGIAGPLHEDPNGDVWAGRSDGALLRWERASGRLQVEPGADPAWGRPTSLADARGGGLWVGFWNGQLARLREGRFEPLALPGARTDDRVSALFRDRAGRLWVAAGRSPLASVTDDGEGPPRAALLALGDRPRLVQSLGEDAFGRLYLGTDAGVVRFDPRGGRLRAFGTADGLAAAEITSTFSDAAGRLWFGTRDGLSVLEPSEDAPAAAPEVRVRALRVAGAAQAVSALGTTRVEGLTLGPDEAQIEIEYGALGLRMGERLRYRYRLEGADAAFAPPTAQRTVNYAHLAPGVYRFVVEAASAEGLAGPPATVAFRVLPPFWQRASFLVPAVLAVALLAYAAFRYRLRALLEVERVRTSIATDLHDDIGSSLSKIAILSEVARRDGGAGSSRHLSTIADISRELVDSMSDIVWAVNPRRDSLLDLTQRMRAFATELFSAQGVALRFEAPEGGAALRIPTGLRRQVFLVFKEAVTNAASHSGCRHAEVALTVAQGSLSLTVADDGRGLGPPSGDGHGLATMAARARALQGDLAVESSPAEGTRVVLRVPLARRQWRWSRAT